MTDNGDGTHTFSPNENFNGEISSDDLSYSVSDGTETTNASMSITVNDVNDAPVAGDTTYSINEDGVINLSVEQLLANSSDVDGSVSVDSVAYTGTDGIFTQNEDGSVSFAPNENFNGRVSLDITVVDDDGATANIRADVDVIAVNDPPVAGGVCGSISEGGAITFTEEQLLASSNDIDGDAISIADVSYGGTDGILVDNGDGSWTFTPNENYNGKIDFSITVSDGTLEDTTEACIMVEAVNNAPVVSGDLAYSVDEDGAITFNQDQLLANASDVDGDDLSASNLNADGDSTVVDNGDGTFTVTPDADFNGDIQISFDVTDGQGFIVGAGVGLTVNPVNDVAVVQDQTFNMNEDGTITITDEQLLAGATDIDGDTLSIDSVSYTDTDGVLTDNGDGSHTFAPNENFNGDVA
jgi:hypothetical protein